MVCPQIPARFFAVVAIFAFMLGCAGSQLGRSRSSDGASQIGRVAELIARDAVVPVDQAALLAEATRAIEAAARAGTSGDRPVPDRAAKRSLSEAIDGLRDARPDADDATVLGIAVTAMAGALMDGSHFVDAKTYRLLYGTKTINDEAGFGVAIKDHRPHPLVSGILPGGPAAGSGIAIGDELRAVDGHPTTGLSLQDVISRLRGPAGTAGTLEVGRPGEVATRQLSLRRWPLDHGTVDCRVIDGRILYLGVPAIGPRTAERVKDFASAPGEQARLVILDLRGNTGGSLVGSSALADDFLESGRIMTALGRAERKDFYAHPGTSPLERAQVAVLVDRDTGSGAEVVAAALQDSHRGVVFGSQTAARADVEMPIPLAGGLLRLTIGVLHRANGDLIDGKGVTPDVVLNFDGPTATSALATGPPAATESLTDVTCPSFISAGPVSADPAVARAAAFLLSR